MSRRDLNAVKKWLEEGECVLYHGMSFTLAELISMDGIEEADVAAALFFHAWDSPQAFWNAVLEERNVRRVEDRLLGKKMETFGAEDFVSFMKCAHALAEGRPVGITVSWRDGDGTLHETCAELNDLLTAKDARESRKAGKSGED